MENLEKDWRVKGNELSLSMWHYHAGIKPVIKQGEYKNKIVIRATITNEQRKKMVFTFNTYEEAVNFCNTVYKCDNDEDMKSCYLRFYGLEPAYPAENNIDLTDHEDGTISMFLTKNDIEDVIADYYEDFYELPLDHTITPSIELSIKRGQADVQFYAIESYLYCEIELKKKVLITYDILKKMLNEYAGMYGFELVDFKFIGGVHSFYYDEDQTHFEGIRLYVKQLDQILELKQKGNYESTKD